MATDRMYLACACGSEFRLARYLFPPWNVGSNPEQLGERLDAWFEEHQFCGQGEPGYSYPAKPTLRFGSDGPPPEKTVAFYEALRASQTET